MTKIRVLVGFLVTFLFVAGCGAPADRGGGTDVGEVSEALAPAGSDAQLIPGSFPTSWAPGERQVVQVTMKNIGAVSPTNDWTAAGPSYALAAQNTDWTWSYTIVPTPVAVGSQNTFSFVVTAPTNPNIYAFSARMRVIGAGDFGDVLTVPNISVSTATTPEYGCTYLSVQSTVPTALAPNQNSTVTIAVQNSGTAAWPASGFFLISEDSPANLWQTSSSALTTAVNPGGVATFTFNIKAPSTPQSPYPFTREMKDSTTGGIGAFRLAQHCVNLSINVGGTPLLDASVSSVSFPDPMVASDTQLATVVMTNTGSETWDSSGNYQLFTQNSPASLWAEPTQTSVSATTVTGTTATFTFPVTAPSVPQGYTQQWQMRKVSGNSAGYFGALVSVPVTVTAGTVQYNAALASQTIPSLMTAGKPYTFSIAMTNTGTQPWVAPFRLYTINTPVANQWFATQSLIGASETVNPGTTRIFNLPVTAPATAGTYSSTWQMRESATLPLFGDIASATGLVVTKCGNNIIDAGEQCDDNNLANGDGCSTTCQLEAEKVYDLASVQANRTLLGPASKHQLAPVTIGDVTGDNKPEVFVSEAFSPASVTPSRGGAGAIYGFSGGAAFFTGTSTAVPSTATVTIAGAKANDGLGAVSSGRIVLGEVTGDTAKDLIVSAPGYDGTAGTRCGAGAAYVLTGGSALMTAGLVDLGAASPPAALRTTIVGATGVAQISGSCNGTKGGDALVALAVGDLTGDGKTDLLLGAPGDTTNGSDGNGVAAGALYIIPGPIAAGTIDLSAPPAGVVKILGANPGDQLGLTAAIGDFMGSNKPDLLAGAGNSAPGGRTRAGAAFAKAGPITTNLDFHQAVGSATGASVAWYGAFTFDGFGGDVGIANVTGTSANEVMIGAIQYQNPSGAQVGAVTIWSGLTAGTTYDLSAGASPAAAVLGAAPGNNCGSAFALGDMNKDGFDDIIMGCSGANGPSGSRAKSGEVDVIFGGSSTFSGNYDLGTRNPQLVMYSPTAGDAMARHVTSIFAGDIDSDGKVDFCGGAYLGGTNGAINQPGRVDCIKSPF